MTKLALRHDACEAECALCSTPCDETGLCDTCQIADREGITVEQARLDVEDLARSFTARFASAEGKPCTCGAGSGVVVLGGPKKRGRGGELVGRIHFDVTHAEDCPRSPGRFDWPDIDEDARERLYGYRGRERHAARLAGALREVLAEREVMET